MGIIRTLSAIVAWVGALALVACNGTPSETVCGQPRLNLSVAADSGWRARIIADLRSSPDTAQVPAVFFFASELTDGDRQLLASIGAAIEYEFRGIPAVSVRLPVADLREFATTGSAERVTNVEIPNRIYPTDCE